MKQVVDVLALVVKLGLDAGGRTHVGNEAHRATLLDALRAAYDEGHADAHEGERLVKGVAQHPHTTGMAIFQDFLDGCDAKYTRPGESDGQ